jgi:hypothetical protein
MVAWRRARTTSHLHVVLVRVALMTSHRRWSGSSSCTHRLTFQTFLEWDMKFKLLTNSKTQDLIDALGSIQLVKTFHAVVKVS